MWIGMIGINELLVVFIMLLVTWFVAIYPFYRILDRIGKNKWLSLISVIPFGVLILLYYIAFTDWKVKY